MPFVRSFTQRQAMVVSVGESHAEVIDRTTGNLMNIPVSAPGGVLPVPGDLWLIDNARTGLTWRFMSCLFKFVPDERSFADTARMLALRGVINPQWSVESPSLAFIGEIRFSALELPSHRWRLANGQSLNRHHFPRLGMILSPGTTPTFAVPNVTVEMPGAVKAYICAR